MISKFDNVKGHIFCAYGGNIKVGYVMVSGIVKHEPLQYFEKLSAVYGKTIKVRYVVSDDFFNDLYKLKEKMKEHKHDNNCNFYETTLTNCVMEMRTICHRDGCYTHNVISDEITSSEHELSYTKNDLPMCEYMAWLNNQIAEYNDILVNGPKPTHISFSDITISI